MMTMGKLLHMQNGNKLQRVGCLNTKVNTFGLMIFGYLESLKTKGILQGS